MIPTTPNSQRSPSLRDDLVVASAAYGKQRRPPTAERLAVMAVALRRRSPAPSIDVGEKLANGSAIQPWGDSGGQPSHAPPN